MKELKAMDPRVDESCRVNVQKTKTWEDSTRQVWVQEGRRAGMDSGARDGSGIEGNRVYF